MRNRELEPLSRTSRLGKAFPPILRGNHSFHGFTLIEVIVVIAVMAILAGAMAPMVVRSLDSSRIELTQKRLKTAYEASMGADGTQGGGFLADLGRLPNNTLTELVAQSGLPAFTTAGHAGNVGMGWRGPYLIDGIVGGRPTDGWGTPLSFTGGQVRSAGADRIAGNGDDLVYPSLPLTITTGNININVQVFDSSAGGAYVQKGTSTTFFWAANGVQQSSTVAIPLNGPFVSPALPQGIHAVTVTGDPDGPGIQPAQTATIAVYGRAGAMVQQTVGLRP